MERLSSFNDVYDIPIRVFENPLRTAEAGKAVAVREAKGDVVLLLDSDNIIPKAGWLSRMMAPFEDDTI